MILTLPMSLISAPSQERMGAGGSTSRPNSATVVTTTRRSASSDRSVRPGSSLPDRPTDSCCSHYKENHAGLTRTVSPAASHVTTMKDDSIDDEIEEIVANTLDIVSNRTTSRSTTPSERLAGHVSRDESMVGLARVSRDESMVGLARVSRDVPSSAVSNSGVRRILRSGSSRRLQKRPSVEEFDVQYDAKVSGSVCFICQIFMTISLNFYSKSCSLRQPYLILTERL